MGLLLKCWVFKFGNLKFSRRLIFREENPFFVLEPFGVINFKLLPLGPRRQARRIPTKVKIPLFTSHSFFIFKQNVLLVQLFSLVTRQTYCRNFAFMVNWCFNQSKQVPRALPAASQSSSSSSMIVCSISFLCFRAVLRLTIWGSFLTFSGFGAISSLGSGHQIFAGWSLTGSPWSSNSRISLSFSGSPTSSPETNNGLILHELIATSQNVCECGKPYLQISPVHNVWFSA